MINLKYPPLILHTRSQKTSYPFDVGSIELLPFFFVQLPPFISEASPKRQAESVEKTDKDKENKERGASKAKELFRWRVRVRWEEDDEHVLNGIVFGYERTGPLS